VIDKMMDGHNVSCTVVLLQVDKDNPLNETVYFCWLIYIQTATLL